MADLLFIAVAVAFFALAALYVTACDRLIGRDTPGVASDSAVEGDAEEAAR